MLDAEEVAGTVLVACTPSLRSRIIKMQMGTMAGGLA